MIKGLNFEVGGRVWHIREAKSLQDAFDAIASSRASGSVGSKHIHDRRQCGGEYEVLADVVRLDHLENDEK